MITTYTEVREYTRCRNGEVETVRAHDRGAAGTRTCRYRTGKATPQQIEFARLCRAGVDGPSARLLAGL